MKVKDLRNLLEKYPEELDVMIAKPFPDRKNFFIKFSIDSGFYQPHPTWGGYYAKEDVDKSNAICIWPTI